MKHIISINDFTRQEIEGIIKDSQKMIIYTKTKNTPPEADSLYKPKVALLFFEPSTRTLGSYEEAAHLLGWPCRIVSGAETTSLKKKESLANTIRMFASQGAEIIILRTKEEGAARFAAEILEKTGFENVAVHNGGDGANQHPSQTFLDHLTILETLGRTKNFTFGFVGDLKYSRTVHSLISSFGPEDNVVFKLISCAETKVPAKYKRNLKVVESESLDELKDCDIIYVTRIQEERFTNVRELEKVKGKYRIDEEILNTFKEKVKIMHPMPYVDEISPEIRSDPRLIIDSQAWYGIPTRMNLLLSSSKHLIEKLPAFPAAEVQKEVIKKINIDTYLEQRKKEEKYFRPIRNGVVLDHLDSGAGDKIKKYLRANKVFKNGGVIHLIENVPSGKMGFKDILILENIFIPESLFNLIIVIAPKATFNILKYNTLEKIKIEMPKIVSGTEKIPCCLNNLCITNLDPEAEAKFEISQPEEKDFVLKCIYCEKEFSRKELVDNI